MSGGQFKEDWVRDEVLSARGSTTAGRGCSPQGARGKSIYKNLNFFLERIQPEKLYPTSLRVCWRGRRVGVGVSRMSYFLIWDLSPVTI